MRKYLIGFIAGLLLASAFPAYGAVSSMVGKTVQAENAVVVNGVELDVKAVNIGGTTYTPNRALAEALKAEIRFEDSKVILNTQEGEVLEQPIDAPETIVDPIQSELNQINMRLTEIYKAEGEYIGKKAQLMTDWNTNVDKRDEIEAQSDVLDADMKILVEERDQLEARKAELEAQQQAQTTP